MLKIKSFIYRFSAIFGLRIYLAKREEDAYVNASKLVSGDVSENICRGSWQARHGFTTVWTYRMSFFEALKAKIKHAFRR